MTALQPGTPPTPWGGAPTQRVSVTGGTRPIRGAARGDSGDGRHLGPYRLVQVLGEGGMGVVHLGLDPRGRAVAIKVLRDHVGQDQDSRARLAREVSSLARVRTPRVAPVLDADTTGPRPYVVTQYVPGVGLDAYVRENGPFQGADLARLGRGLGEAITAIHAAGVIHRDLKPGNVLIVEGGDPVVIDFGIAHIADDIRLTSTGLVMGTPGYLSPEVVGGGAVTPSTDWWGWAATLVFAATGRPPFGRGAMHVVLDAVRDGRADLDGLPAGLRDLFTRALQPDVASRPAPAELLARLQECARAEPEVPPTAVQQVRSTVRMPVDPPPPVVATPTSVAAAPAAADLGATPARPVTRPQPVVPAARPAQDAPAASVSQASPVPPAPAPVPVAPATGRDAAPVANGTSRPDAIGDPRLGLPGRSGALTVLALALAALAATLPLVALATGLVWAVAARTSDRVVTATVLRRHAFGTVRRSDGLVAALKSPVHLLTAVLSTILTGLLAALVGASTAFLFSVGAGAVTGREFALLGAPALLLGTLAGVWTAWWGPGGTSLRRGSRSMMRAMTPGGTGRDLVTSLMALATLVLLAWSFITHGVPSFAPYGSPSGRIPWQW